MKIQSPYCPSVVQVFCPLTIQSSPSRTAVVRRLARSEPASGSEKPCDHQMSRLAVLGRKRSFCSWLPNCAEHRADHRGVEGQRRRNSGALHLLVPQVSLQAGPALAAPLLGPVRHREAGRVERLLAGHDLVAGQVLAREHLVADVLRELGGEEGPHLVTKCCVLGGQLQLHAAPRRRKAGRSLAVGVKHEIGRLCVCRRRRHPGDRRRCRRGGRSGWWRRASRRRRCAGRRPW